MRRLLSRLRRDVTIWASLWGVPLIITLSCFVASSLCADTIVLKDGRSITGIITQEDESQVEIEIYYGAGKIIDKYSLNNVKEVIKDKEENLNILRRYVGKFEEVEKKERMKKEAELRQKEAEEEQKRIEAELEIQRQAEKEREEKREQIRKELEIRKEERIKRKKAFAVYQAKIKEIVEESKQREIEDKAFRFGRISSYRKYEPPYADAPFDTRYYQIYFEGLFYNEGTRTKKNVTVMMSFYDLEGKWIAWRNAYTAPTNVPPGEMASFTIKISNAFRFVTYDVSATWEY